MDYELNTCIRLTTDAIGKPGQRTFFLQGETDTETITLIFEKIQLQSLIVAIIKFFEDLHQKYPDLSPENGEFFEEKMRITPPVDPLFRIGEFSLSYDKTLDQICIISKEIVFQEKDPSIPFEGQIDGRTVKFWATRDQFIQLVNWGVELIQRGRPICPLCNEPINPEGHLCPKKNGHKKH